MILECFIKIASKFYIKFLAKKYRKSSDKKQDSYNTNYPFY